MAYNSITLAGNVTRDPEIRYSIKGTGICSFSLAVNEPVKGGPDAKDRTMYVDCKLIGAASEAAHKALRKGTPVIVVGKLELEMWTDKATEQVRKKHAMLVWAAGIAITPAGNNAPPASEEGKADQVPY
jgi:single-strand DNA-binding protein